MTSPNPGPALNRSCTNCPSFLKPEESVSKFKKSVGSPVCGRYGHVLGKPGLKAPQADKLARHFAQKCPAYGEPMPPVPLETKFAVTLPDPEVITAPIDPVARDRCSSCAMCKNFIRDDVVSDELGWNAGLCAAKGKLILPNRQTYEARDCEYRQYPVNGTTRRTTTGLHLLPEYEDAFNLNVDPVRAFFKNKDNFVDPKDWPTEKDVSERDKQQGIRAWRKIRDQEGTGNEVFLPIYDKAFFSEPEYAKVPQAGDDEHAESYVDHNNCVYRLAVLWTQLDETPALWGKAGVGKTELMRHMAWMMQLPFERISITGSTELDDLAGRMRFSPSEGTYFQYGRIAKAWTKPCVVVFDELNAGQPDVLQFCRPMFDNSKQLVLDMNENEELDRHTDCYIGLAMNPAWDPLNVGTMQIGAADADRLIHIYMDLPPSVLEREIIRTRVGFDGWEIDDNRLDMLMAIATDIRGLTDDQTLPISWGIRPQIKVARALRWFDTLTAYRMAVGDYLDPEQQQILLDQVKAHADPVF